MNRLERARRERLRSRSASLRKDFDKAVKDAFGNADIAGKNQGLLTKLLRRKSPVKADHPMLWRYIDYIAQNHSRRYGRRDEAAWNQWRKDVGEAIDYKDKGIVPSDFLDVCQEDKHLFAPLTAKNMGLPHDIKDGYKAIRSEAISVEEVMYRGGRSVTRMTFVYHPSLDLNLYVERPHDNDDSRHAAIMQHANPSSKPRAEAVMSIRRAGPILNVDMDALQRVPTIEENIDYNVVQSNLRLTLASPMANAGTGDVDIIVFVDEVDDYMLDFHFVRFQETEDEPGFLADGHLNMN